MKIIKKPVKKIFNKVRKPDTRKFSKKTFDSYNDGQNEYIKECLERIGTIGTSDYRSNLFDECLDCALEASENGLDWKIDEINVNNMILSINNKDNIWTDKDEEFEQKHTINVAFNLYHLLPVLGFDTIKSLEMFLKDYFETNQMLY
jgi:hypothetical protein